ncbi:YoaK family protein (plasmid) [Rhizobium sp. SYY.PMSO]
MGFFSANMTGNVSTLSDHIATMEWLPALFYLAIVLVFILGAALSSIMINAGRRRGTPGIYAYSILTEALLLLPLAGVDLLLAASAWRVTILVLGLAFLMGLQNATVTRISDARVRTTHVSGMATDIGIELGIALDILRGKDDGAHSIDNRAKLRLHLLTIGSFLIGGVIGVLLYQAIAGYLLIVASALLLAIALRGLHRTRALAKTTATRRLQ